MTNSKSPAPPAPVRFSKKTDGIDHINISPQGLTDLGVLLAHFTESRFTHDYLGPFTSMEGFWYYVKAAIPDDKLRNLHGKSAYMYGKTLPSIRRRHFQEIIMDGNYFKILQNEKLKELFINSTLPLTQYYNFGPNAVPINPKTMPWIVTDFEELRDIFKKGDEKEIVPYSEYLDVVTPRKVVKK